MGINVSCDILSKINLNWWTKFTNCFDNDKFRDVTYIDTYISFVFFFIPAMNISVIIYYARFSEYSSLNYIYLIKKQLL